MVKLNKYNNKINFTFYKKLKGLIEDSGVSGGVSVGVSVASSSTPMIATNSSFPMLRDKSIQKMDFTQRLKNLKKRRLGIS